MGVWGVVLVVCVCVGVGGVVLCRSVCVCDLLIFLHLLFCSRAYSAAGAIGSEALQSMRTVASFGLERRTARRYNAELAVAERVGVAQAWLSGLSVATLLSVTNIYSRLETKRTTTDAIIKLTPSI